MAEEAGVDKSPILRAATMAVAATYISGCTLAMFRIANTMSKMPGFTAPSMGGNW
jgi:hypothetical protein